MDVFEAIHGRRSIRSYLDEPVDHAVIADLVWAAVQAPTPPISGDRAWALCVIEGVERLAEYGERAKAYARDHPPEGVRLTWPERADFKVFWNAPALVLLCARSGNPEAPFDCCRAGQNLLLAAHARGLGSCWVGAPMLWLASEGIAEELGLPVGFKPSVAVLLGYSVEQPMGQPRPRPTIHWL